MVKKFIFIVAGVSCSQPPESSKLSGGSFSNQVHSLFPNPWSVSSQTVLYNSPYLTRLQAFE